MTIERWAVVKASESLGESRRIYDNYLEAFDDARQRADQTRETHDVLELSFEFNDSELVDRCTPSDPE